MPALFNALVHTPAILAAREAYGRALREDSMLNPKLRELAICNVARLNGGGYEYDVHKRSATAVGVSPEQIADLASFEASPHFADEERAVLHYSAEVTLSIRVSDPVWNTCAAMLSAREMVELVLTCAWYNQTARVTWPLQLTMSDQA